MWVSLKCDFPLQADTGDLVERGFSFSPSSDRGLKTQETWLRPSAQGAPMASVAKALLTHISPVTAPLKVCFQHRLKVREEQSWLAHPLPDWRPNAQ